MGADGGYPRKEPAWASAALFVLPLLYLIMALVLRMDRGPFWLWPTIDPSYFYLLDAVNFVNLTAPGHVAHPGTPLQVIGAVVLWIMHGFSDPAAVTETVLRNPENYLRIFSSVLYAMNGLALVAVGFAARAVLRGMLPALLVQVGPFVSTVVIRHGLDVKPEALLIFASLLLAFVTLLAMRPGALERHRTAYPVVFGLLAGFGVATKVSAAPIFILPVFLLWGVRPLLVYAVSCVVGLLLFLLPAAGAYHEFWVWMSGIVMKSGHFGQGEATVIDFAAYPHSLAKLFSRPVLFLPILGSGGALIAAWRRKRRGLAIPSVSVRALAGVVLAQVFQIVVAAKHPSAHYVLPALVLSGLTVALLYDVVSRIFDGSDRARFRGRQVVVGVFIVFLVAQAAAVVEQDFELRDWYAEARTVDNADFDQCLRVDFQFASDPVYALYYSNYITRQKLADRLAALYPVDRYWFDSVSRTFRDWRGPLSLPETMAEYPCAMFRGQERGILESFLEEVTPDVVYRDDCSTRDETVLTTGVDCRGELTGR